MNLSPFSPALKKITFLCFGLILNLVLAAKPGTNSIEKISIVNKNINSNIKPNNLLLFVVAPVHNLTQNTFYTTIQLAINAAVANDVIECSPSSYMEKVIIDKSLTLQGTDEVNCIIDGTGLGTGSGIVINVGISNVTIKYFTIKNHSGTAPNSYAGIYAIGGNNNLSVTHCTIQDNIGGCGFYANGPVNGITLDDLEVFGHTAAFGAARGIVIWNGFKQNISITNCNVYNNNCCGIELQDGTASGIFIDNNNVHDNADNGIGVLGFKAGAGSSNISNNTVANNGRFGIEIKNPNANGLTTGDGSVIIHDNNVSLVATAGMNIRDHAGISIYRRAFESGNPSGYPNIPTGVVVQNNTVSGYTHLNPLRVESEGFGIAIEGTNHSVLNNTVSNNNIGIQQQGGGHPNPNYVPDDVGDGDQSDNKSANYFGRGNAPVACGNSISGNTFSGNTSNTRNSFGAGSFGMVVNTNTGETFCSIQAAINDAQTLNGHTLKVGPGTYNEQVLVNKSLTITMLGVTQPIVDFTGTTSGKPCLFDVSVDGVTIDNIHFNVDLSKLRSAIIASSPGLDNINITNNLIDCYGVATGSYGDRNAVSVNYGGTTNYRVATGGVDNIQFTGNTVNFNGGSFFRSGISTDESAGNFNNNTLATGSHDILHRFGNNGPVTITGNNSNGGGIEVADQNASAGTISISNNIFSGAGAPFTAMLRIKNNYNSISHIVNGNTFNNYDWGVSLENMNSITLDNNTFNTAVPNAHAIALNTKSITTNSNTIVQVPIAGIFTNNNFNGTGTGLSFLNHDSDNDSYGTITIGTVGNENKFASTLSSFVTLDNQIGSSDLSTIFPNYPVLIGTGGTKVTTMACWDVDLNIQNNKYDVGAGFQLPTAMNFAGLNTLETKLTHKPDFACLGYLTYFYPVHNLTQNTYFLTIQSSIAAAVANDVIECSPWLYNEKVTIDKTLTLQGTDEVNCIIDGTGLGTGSGIVINNGITNVIIKYFTIKNHSGTGPNSYAGIYAIGGNNSLSVTHCTIKDNVGGCGFYANGPVNGITLDNLEVSGHTNAFGAARGIVIWNGFKQNISITNCNVHNNNCCGIELQDGTASGIFIDNNNVHDNGDNGIGVIGFKAGAGSSNISNNTVANNGRFGIEIKNPDASGLTTGDGSVIIHDNNVSLVASAGMNIRDHAGISIYRRAFESGNPSGYPNIPTGVVVQNNTVSGFKNLNPGRVESEGFGIVIEGTNHSVLNNTVNNNNIGIQQQGGGHPNPNYVPDDVGDGDQSDNKSANYFGRGNAPVACGNSISGNTFSGNTSNTRNSFGAGSFGMVMNTNTGETFCSIQAAINDAQTLNGHTLMVSPGTYMENITVSKSLTILGPNANIDPCTGVRTAEAIVVPATNGISTVEIFHVAASNVIIKGFTIDGDNTLLASGFLGTNGADINAAEGVTVYETGVNGLQVVNNIFQNLSYFGVTLYDYPAGVPSSNHLISNNKFQDLGTYDPLSGIDYWGGGVLLYNNQYARVIDNCMMNVRIGVQTGNFYAANPGSSNYQQISGNTISARRRGVFHNLFYGTASPYTFSNNTFTGISNANETYWDGILVASQSVSSNLSGNNITGIIPTNPSSGIQVWNVKSTSPALISGGMISGVSRGVFVNNYDSYPSTGSDAPDGGNAVLSNTTINGCPVGIYVKDNTLSTHASVNLSITGGVNVTGGATGLLIENSAATVGSTISNTAFAGQSGDYITLSGTAMDNLNIDATASTFEGSTGAAKTLAQNFAVEDKITHAQDNASLGFVLVKSGEDFVTTNSGSIQRGIDDASNGFIVNVNSGLYSESAIVDKSVTILGPNANIDPCTGMRTSEAIVVTKIPDGVASAEIFHVAASGVVIKGFTIDGDSPLLTSGVLGTNGADIDAAEGITVYETGINGLQVVNNIFQNLSYFGVTLYDFSAGVPSSGHLISNNKFQDLGTYDPLSGIENWGGGVLMYNNQYARVVNNCMTNVRMGVQTGNFSDANPGSSIYQEISNNNVSTRRLGVFHNLFYGSASPYTFSNNTITGISNPNETKWDGILVSSQSVASTISGNNITGIIPAKPSTGIQVWNVKSTSPASISGGSISGVSNGVFLNNFEGYESDASDGAHATIDAVTITNCPIGIKISDSPASSHALVSATVYNNNKISSTGTGTGILVLGSNASANIHHNNASIHGFGIGIDVDGGNATIENNHIYDNRIGIRFLNNGLGTVKTNKFFDPLTNGTDLQILVSAGVVTATDNNWFAGSTYAIENLNMPPVDATLNYWNASNGPGSNGPGSGSKISGNVQYCQFLNDVPIPLGGTGVPVSPDVTIVITENSNIPNDGLICSGTSTTLDATTSGAQSYLWSTGSSSSSISLNPMSTDTYTVTVSFNGCTVIKSTTITVYPVPACLITGTTGPVCPGSSNDYQAPMGMSNYMWTISGDAIIFGANNTQMVTVKANNACNGSYTLNLVVTDINGCTSSCSIMSNVVDVTKPVVMAGNILPCYKTVLDAETDAINATTASDVCPGLLVKTAATIGTCSAVITVTVKDGCYNEESVQYNTRIDNTAPNFDNCPSNILLNNTPGTCGSVASYSNLIANDNCPGILNILQVDGTGLSSGSTFPVGSTIQTYEVTDQCGNVNTCSFQIIISDTEDPKITCPIDIVQSNDIGFCSAVVNYTTPVGTDNCNGAITTQTAGLASGSIFPKGITTNTFKVTDASNNMTTCSFTVTVNDAEDPKITCPIDIVQSNDIGLCSAVVNYTTPVGTDNCSGAITTQTAGLASGAIFPKGITTNTFKVTDASNNMTTCSFTVTVNDTEDPKITCLIDIVQSNDIGLCSAVVNYTTPVGTDNCSGAITTQTAGLASGAIFPKGITTNTFKVTDASNNMTTCSFTVTVNDAEDPKITCPIDIVQSNDIGLCSAVVNYTTPVGTDNCSGAITTQTAGLASGAIFPKGITTNTFKVTDASNNMTTCSFTVTVNDAENPKITCPIDIVQSNDIGLCSAVVNYTTPVGTDNCSGAITTQTAGLASGAIFPKGITTNTFKVTDASNNMTTCSFTVTINDTENPKINCPSTINVNTDLNLCSAIVNYLTPVGTDNCPGASTVLTSGLASGSAFPRGNNNVVYTVTDNTGNSTSCNFDINVSDMQFPVITCPGNIIQSNDLGLCSAVVNYISPVGTDNCPFSSTVLSSGMNSGSIFPIGQTMNIFTVTDASGHSSSCSFTITVQDNEKPVITCPSNIIQSTDLGFCTAIVNYIAPIGTDNCPNAMTVQIAGLASGAAYPKGVTNNSFEVTDASGNKSSCSFSVTVNDNEKPVITCPLNIIQSTDVGLCTAIVNYISPVGTDNCPGQLTVLISGLASGLAHPKGITNNTFEVTDASGNKASCSFSVTINDNEKPLITCPSNIIQSTDLGLCTAIVNYIAPVGTDNCPGAMTVQIAGMASGAVYPKGVTNNSFEVTDASGNKSSCSFSVTVNDNEKPVINCPSNIIQSTDLGLCTAIVNYVPPVGIDNCPSAMTVQISGLASGVAYPKGVTNNSFEVTDASGNKSSCTFSITVNDNEKPVITCPSNIIQATNLGLCTSVVNYIAPVGTDNCPGAMTVRIAGLASGAAYPKGVTNNTFEVTDASGNKSSCTFSVTVNDNEKPVITCPANISVNNTIHLCSAIVNYTAPVGTDNCPSALTVLSSGLASGSVFPVGTTTNVYTVTDASGNTASCSFDVKVIDAEAPVPSCPPNVMKFNDAGLCSAKVFYTATATDNCNIVTISYSPSSGTVFPVGVSNVTVTATDGATNSAQCNFSVTVKDNEIPVLNCPITQQLRNANSNVCTYTIVGAEFDISPTDNCGISSKNYLINGLISGSNSVAGKILNKGSNSIKWTVTDVNGNVSMCTTTVIVIDNQLPSLTCKPDVTKNINLSASCQYYVIGTEFNLASYSDNCNGPYTLSWKLTGATINNGTNTLAGVFFEKGVTTITWTITDASGNSASCSSKLTVIDNIPPSITCKTDQTRGTTAPECKYLIVGSEFDATALDNCAMATTAYSLSGATLGSGSTTLAGKKLEKGITTITWTVTDMGGNTKQCSFKVTVVDDDAPVIMCRLPQSRSALAYACKYKTIGNEFDLVSSSDNCGIFTTQYSITGVTTGSGSNTLANVYFKVGVSTVVWKVTDLSGIMSTCSFTITVNDIDSDCDGVLDCSDQCPGGNDKIDNNNDGKPDCKYPPTYAQMPASWKCGVPQFILICHLNNGLNHQTQCITFSQLAPHLAHGDYCGPCDQAKCNNLVKSNDNSENENQSDKLVIRNKEDLNIKVYPNPTTNEFIMSIDNPSMAEYQISVYDSFGKLVRKFKGHTISSEIKFGDELQAGMYTLSIESKEFNKTIRLVKLD